MIRFGNMVIYYKLVNRKALWSRAVKLCARMNSYLVEVDDQPEHNIIVSIMWENLVCVIWPGASYVEAEGRLVWNHSG